MALTQEDFDALKLRLIEKQNNKTPAPTKEDRSVPEQVLAGGGKGILSTLRGASSLAERGFKAAARTILPKRFERGFEEERPTSAEQVISEEAITPTTIAEKAGFGVEQVAEFFLPTGLIGAGAKVAKGFSGASKVSKLAKVGAKATGLAADVAVKTAAQEGEFGKEAVIAGVATPIVGGVLSRAGRTLFKSLPERMVQKAIGQSKKDILAGKDVAKFALGKKKFGTAKSLINDSNTEITKLDTEINKILKSIPVTKDKITVKKIANDVAGEINSKGGEISSEEVIAIINKLAPQSKGLLSKPTMGIFSANSLRSSIDKTLGDRGFLTAQLPFNKDVLRQFTNTLRAEVQTKAPTTKKLFSDFTNEIRLRDALLENVAGDQATKVLGLTDFLTLGGVGVTGGVGPALGVLGAKKAAESTPFLTGAGVTLNELSKALPILEKLAPAERQILSDIIKKILYNQNKEE